VAAATPEFGGDGERSEFRTDLYYRLERVSIQLPPCGRRTDIPALVAHFRDFGGDGISNEHIRGDHVALSSHDWPGISASYRT